MTGTTVARLVAPHIIRLITGADLRFLLSANALGGSIFLVLTDVVLRFVLSL
ncbi:iron chelate uptake ABC transporter family permease subunit [Paenibacillus vandeheii]